MYDFASTRNNFPEASEVSNSQLREDIKKTLHCDWLAEIEGV
jgi:hypothetical protein